MLRFYLTTPAFALLDQGVLTDLSVSREGVVRELLEGDLGAVLDAAEREAMTILQPDGLGSHPRFSNKTKAAREVLEVCCMAREDREDRLSANSSALISSLIKRSPLAAAALLSGFDLFDHAENSQFWSLPDFALRMLCDNILLSESYAAESDGGAKCGFISWCVRGLEDNMTFFYPFYAPGELLYLKSDDKEGTYQMPDSLGRLSSGRYRVVLRFTTEDIPQALRGTLKLFARDRTLMKTLMTEFNDRN